MANELTNLVDVADAVVAAFYRLGKCEDEFGHPSEYCAEYADALDSRILDLQTVLRKLFPCPRCDGQAHDVGACGLCNNRGYLLEQVTQDQSKHPHE